MMLVFKLMTSFPLRHGTEATGFSDEEKGLDLVLVEKRDGTLWDLVLEHGGRSAVFLLAPFMVTAVSMLLPGHAMITELIIPRLNMTSMTAV